ncbi:MAG: EAL domain-containing protein, partial [Treponema sp.]|nr:EAL domain-containing protein [Treponema sp.]
FSAGIACFPEDATGENELIMKADTAMFQAKGAGKNTYVFYEAAMQQILTNKNDLENIMREALQTDGYKMVYQPLVDVVTGEIRSYEALVRLKNYNISAGDFIRVAEESDLILELDFHLLIT